MALFYFSYSDYQAWSYQDNQSYFSFIFLFWIKKTLMRYVNCNCSYFMTIVSLGSGGTWSDCGFILVSWYSWLGGLCKQKQSLSSEFWQGWSAPSLHSWLSTSKNDDSVVSYHWTLIHEQMLCTQSEILYHRTPTRGLQLISVLIAEHWYVNKLCVINFPWYQICVMWSWFYSISLSADLCTNGLKSISVDILEHWCVDKWIV